MAQADTTSFIEILTQDPDQIRFEDSMAIIEANYSFTPSAFTNGEQNNAAGENSGSCKVFAFAQLQALSKQQTLALFGQYYQDVLDTPQGEDHQNIRQFIKNGWNGISFSQPALSKKV
ncbi:type III effector [Agarivorans sp. Toyoura001]|uniref:HopJ type III effector protein n=1 Tax=Agarivorans sp. Toyoura001 TaxID=2283141 RepID=UPI0010DDAB9E|nr:HopJ type III effector protein [Agarivorans sp. Toyoura001]GDY28038.1 type III effector [Agarivorans sp. Toyoura001]